MYVGNNPLKFIDPDGKDWFVNNENGNVIFVKGVNELNDDLRAQYNLGKANYENLGADDMFGGLVQWGMYEGNLYNVLNNDFHSFGDLSQNFMKLQGYQGVENLQIEKKETREFSMDRSTDLRESYEIVDISKTYVKKEININRNLKNTHDSEIEYFPFSNQITTTYKSTVLMGESTYFMNELNGTTPRTRIKGGKAGWLDMAKELVKRIKK